MAVLKNDPSVSPAPAAAPRPGGVLSAEIVDAKRKAKNIREEAERRRVEIVAEADLVRDRLLAEGHEEGQETIRAQIVLEIARAKIEFGRAIDEAKPAAMSLALCVAEKVIGRKLDRDESLLQLVGDEMAEQLRRSKALVFRMNPNDAAKIRAVYPKLMDSIRSSVDVVVVEDPAVTTTQCSIKTEFGTWEGELFKQIVALGKVITGRDGSIA